jgi:hypothetical protein
MHLIFLTLTVIAVLRAACDSLEETLLFPDVAPPLLAYNDLDVTKPLDYSDDSGSDSAGLLGADEHTDSNANELLDYTDDPNADSFATNGDLGANPLASSECSGSGPLRRIRGRQDRCLAPQDALPQLQLPSILDDSVTVEDVGLSDLDNGAVQDSLQNQEICPSLVYQLHNIPICSSGSASNREYIWGENTYKLEHCTLCTYFRFCASGQRN